MLLYRLRYGARIVAEPRLQRGLLGHYRRELLLQFIHDVLLLLLELVLQVHLLLLDLLQLLCESVRDHLLLDLDLAGELLLLVLERLETLHQLVGDVLLLLLGLQLQLALQLRLPLQLRLELRIAVLFSLELAAHFTEFGIGDGLLRIRLGLGGKRGGQPRDQIRRVDRVEGARIGPHRVLGAGHHDALIRSHRFASRLRGLPPRPLCTASHPPPYVCRRVHSKPQTTHTRIKTAKIAAFRHTRLHNNRLASSFKRLPRPPHATRLCQRSLPHPVRRPGCLQRPVRALRRYDLLLKASYGSYLWVGESMKMSDFGSAISCFSIREGTLGITAEVIWRSEAVVKPSYGAVKMLT